MYVDDAKLIKKYVHGDQASFETLYNRYRKPLYGYLNRMLDCSVDVDDIYQKTWLKVLRSLTKYREDQKFSAWLFRIAHNTAVDFFRKNKKVPDLINDVVEVESITETATSPLSRLDITELGVAISGALPELPAEQREVFLLRQEGVPFKEIAEIQDTSINTVLGRMRYAILKMRQLLSDWEEQKELA